MDGVGPLVHASHNPSLIPNINASIFEVFQSGLPMNVEIHNYLPKYVVCRIQSYLPLDAYAPNDKLTWKFTSSGKFTLSSAINLLTDDPPSVIAGHDDKCSLPIW